SHTKTHQFREWDLPSGAHPHGLIVDKQGIVFYTGNGNGTIGRLDPATGKVTEYKAPSGGSPHTLIQGPDGIIWFTVQQGRIGRLDPGSGTITEYQTRGRPDALAVARDGAVWFSQLSGDRLGRLDPRPGQITEVDAGNGSGPRRVAATPDGAT